MEAEANIASFMDREQQQNHIATPPDLGMARYPTKVLVSVLKLGILHGNPHLDLTNFDILNFEF